MVCLRPFAENISGSIRPPSPFNLWKYFCFTIQIEHNFWCQGMSKSKIINFEVKVIPKWIHCFCVVTSQRHPKVSGVNVFFQPPEPFKGSFSHWKGLVTFKLIVSCAEFAYLGKGNLVKIGWSFSSLFLCQHSCCWFPWKLPLLSFRGAPPRAHTYQNFWANKTGLQCQFFCTAFAVLNLLASHAPVVVDISLHVIQSWQSSPWFLQKQKNRHFRSLQMISGYCCCLCCQQCEHLN